MPLKRDDLPGILLSSAEKVQRAFLDHFDSKKPAAAAAAVAAPDAPDATMSKAALLEEAKAAGIPGRTKMSKDELVAALLDARGR